MAVSFCARRGFGVFTGCARGADRLACGVAGAAGLPGSLFSVAASAPVSLPAGWSLVSSAGGSGPVRGRLARRSAACVRSARAAGCAGVFVFFSGAVSPGSLLSCSLAARLGLPLVVWGLSASQLAGLVSRPGWCWPGSFVPLGGRWSGFFRFRPAPGGRLLQFRSVVRVPASRVRRRSPRFRRHLVVGLRSGGGLFLVSGRSPGASLRPRRLRPLHCAAVKTAGLGRAGFPDVA
ncbi:MAG TPA: hypothetical protein VHK68_00720, partial [Gemmatimonadales bacterium]|nr:hypothetical protein [Gemmatimonadales bacterium]